MINLIIDDVTNKKFNINTKERYFRQININDKVNYYNIYLNQNYIKDSSAILKIESIKLIDTIKGESYEGQKLSGKKLIICGYIILKFNMKINCKYIVLKKNIPFSTFIVVPDDTTEKNNINLIYSIEDISLANIECNYLFVSVTFLLEYIKNNNTKVIK